MKTSGFYGSGLAVLGYYLLGLLVMTVTAMLGYPALLNYAYNWFFNNVEIDGQSFKYSGKTMDLYKIYFPIIIFTVIFSILQIMSANNSDIFVLTLVLSIPYLCVTIYFSFKLLKYVVSNISINNNNNSEFKGSILGFIGISLLGALCFYLGSLTFGFAVAWYLKYAIEWYYKNTNISGKEMYFDTTIFEVWKTLVIITLLSLITCFIYIPWGVTKFLRFTAERTHFFEE